LKDSADTSKLMREIEIKAKVRDEQATLSKIAELGIELGKAKKHHDVVFCRPGQKDYEPNSVWLRIRTEDDKTVIWTLKKDTGRRLDSIEHEVEVSDAKELEVMLRLMGMELYSDLTKTRRKAKYEDIEICFDVVEGLGTFIEAERIAPDDTDAEPVRRALWDFLTRLGIQPEDESREGYDVMLKTLQ
jgi:adenylate cyclase class 2